MAELCFIEVNNMRIKFFLDCGWHILGTYRLVADLILSVDHMLLALSSGPPYVSTCAMTNG